MISLSHSHFCKHCDRTFICKSTPCLIPGDERGYDISRLHKCSEAKKYRLRMALMLGDKPKCKYGCDSDRKCNHPAEVNQIDGNVTTKQEYTSRYSIDGMTNNTQTRATQRAWTKAKENHLISKFRSTPWIIALAKEFRS